MLVDLKLRGERQGFCTLHDARQTLLCDPRVHRHREFECNLVLRGKARMVNGSRSFQLGAQHLAWFVPGQEHMIMEQSDDFAMWVLVFSPELVRELAIAAPLQDLPRGSYERRISAGNAGRLRSLCERIGSKQLADRHFNQGLGWFLLECWQAFTEAEEIDRGDQLDEAVELAVHLLQNPHGPESLPELARACAVSPSWLSRRFHAQLGCTVSSYRNRQRLQRCLSLAGRDGRNLTEAAFSAGFTSYGQFYQVCRQLTGSGPRELLRQN